MKEKFNKLKTSPSYSGLVLMVAALVVYFLVQYIQDPGTFFTVKTYNNFASLFKNYTPLILITMAQALLMLMGIIDISIGIQLSFANVLAVMLPEWTEMCIRDSYVNETYAAMVDTEVPMLVPVSRDVYKRQFWAWAARCPCPLSLPPRRSWPWPGGCCATASRPATTSSPSSCWR